MSKAKMVAILSYLFLVGWIAALFLNNGYRTTLGTFHVRQSFGIMSLATLMFIIVGLINVLLLTIAVVIPMVILWFLGIIAAFQGKIIPVPIVGKTFQKWFQGI